MAITRRAWAHFYFDERRLALSWVTFISPLSLLAVGVMAINDSYLRVAYPSFFTGKLSDFAVLFFFPLMVCDGLSGLQAGWGLLRRGSHRRLIEATQSKLGISCLFSAVVFVLLQLSDAFVSFYTDLLGWLDWTQSFTAYRYTQDPSDLIALPVLLLAYRYGYARQQRLPLV